MLLINVFWMDRGNKAKNDIFKASTDIPTIVKTKKRTNHDISHETINETDAVAYENIASAIVGTRIVEKTRRLCRKTQEMGRFLFS